jgi:hypothetical protein
MKAVAVNSLDEVLSLWEKLQDRLEEVVEALDSEGDEVGDLLDDLLDDLAGARGKREVREVLGWFQDALQDRFADANRGLGAVAEISNDLDFYLAELARPARRGGSTGTNG